jgi:hypothetical protein
MSKTRGGKILNTIAGTSDPRPSGGDDVEDRGGDSNYILYTY